MVKAIAESRGVAMPSFGGYVVRVALAYHIPVLTLMVLVFLARGTWINLLGGMLAVLLVGRYVHLAWHARRRLTRGRE